MAVIDTRNFSIITDFPSGLYAAGLETEILASPSIYHALDYITVAGDSVSVVFKDTLDAVEVVTLTALVAAHDGVIPAPTDTVTVVGAVDSRSIPSEGSRKNFVTHSWCDNTTWFGGSSKITSEILTDSSAGAGITFQTIHFPVVDLSHGKVFSEHLILAPDGGSYKVSCTVNAVPVVENDKHTGIGDYTIDYSTGAVTFSVARPGAVVSLDYYKVQDSSYAIKPAAGKVLRILEAEASFSDDFNIKDGVIFQMYGSVEKWAPTLAVSGGGTIPDGTKIPIGTPNVYETLDGFIEESNGAYPTIPSTTNPNAATNWRMRAGATLSVPWRYKTSMPIQSSMGMELRIYLEHDQPWEGSRATATFYCVSEVEA